MAYGILGSVHDLVRKLRAKLGLAPTRFGPPRAQLLGRPGYGDQAANAPPAAAAKRMEQ